MKRPRRIRPVAMHWVPCEEALPQNGQAVLVRYAADNWLRDHTLADGQKRKHWRWQAAQFIRGRSAANARRMGVYRMQDEFGNNQRPYCWDEFGPGSLFGQNVTHWAAISDPCGDEEAG